MGAEPGRGRGLSAEEALTSPETARAPFGARAANLAIGQGTLLGMRVRMLAIVQRMRFFWLDENWFMQGSSE